jgi:hypothetical protein
MVDADGYPPATSGIDHFSGFLDRFWAAGNIGF